MIFTFWLQNEFRIFSPAHFLPILFFLLFGVVCIMAANSHLSERSKTLLGTAIACISTLGVFLRMQYMYGAGNFDTNMELPLHLCRILALVAPFVMYHRNRKLLGVMYFMIFAGTLNANITPDIDGVFPESNYFTYWLIHSALLIVPLYAIFVYKMRITFDDAKRAFWYVNVYLVLITLFNWWKGSNYFYTCAKPPSATILDFFGPWPYYLIVTWFIGLSLVGLLYLPWYFLNKSSTENLSK